ncbi:MAG: DHH family phosphoesterase [Conexivisphaerales archaeon]
MSVLNGLRPKRVLLVSHRNADVDGVCSALALKSLVRRINPSAKVDLVAPQGISSQSKRILSLLGERFQDEITRNNYDLVLITDTGHSSLLLEELNKIQAIKGYKVLIDHHPLDTSMKNIVDNYFVDESASSASEMVYRLFINMHKRIDKTTAMLLALGIMADSQFLTIAKNDTIIALSRIIKKGVDLEEVKNILRSRKEVSEQIARIKAVRRARFYRCSDWIIGITNIGSFHSSAARALLEVGCDISAAAGSVDGETRMSIRASQIFYTSTKIHVGIDLCRSLAESVNGNGGGHPTAGSMNARVEADKLLEGFLERLSDILEEGIKQIKE